MARRAIADHEVSTRLACQAFSISETCYRYQPKLSGDNQLIADWLLRLTTTNRNWGFGLCYLYLRNVKGFPYNHKRIYLIYSELELNPRIKPKRRLKRDKSEDLAEPRQINSMWSMDFMRDSLRMIELSRPSMCLMTITVKGWASKSTNLCPHSERSGLWIRS